METPGGTPPGNVPTGQPVSSTGTSSAQPPSQTSTKSVIALVCGILSLTCCGFLSGIPAIFLGKSEIQAIAEGQVPESNRNIAKIGMILGIIGTCLSCLGALVYAILFALGISAGIMEGAFR